MSASLSLSVPVGPLGSGIVALGGSRVLPPIAMSWVGDLADYLAARGAALVTGCATGADQAAIRALSGSPALAVLAAWGRNGAGSCPVSAVSTVQRHAAHGGAVSWWAGGGQRVSLSARLCARTRAVSRACTAGAVVVFSARESRGSLLLARAVTARGLPVVAVAWGFGVTGLPLLGVGSWSPLGSTASVAAARWVPGQGTLAL